VGNYRIVINAVGGHGQDRGKGHGENVDFAADNENAPEAIMLRAVEALKATGNSVTEATVHHWPGTGSEVVDNLLTGRRCGSF
jgi:hypothetical protein